VNGTTSLTAWYRGNKGPVYVPLVATAIAGLLLASCGSSSKSSAPPTTASGSPGTTAPAGTSSAATGTPYLIGLVTDETGPLAAERAQDLPSAQAAAKSINAAGGINGHPISLVVADEQSSPTGAATAFQELVTEKHVLAIASDSNFFDSGEPFLHSHDVAVIGLDSGNSALNPAYTNQFPVGTDAGNSLQQPDNTPQLWAKQHGGTKWAVLCYTGLGNEYSQMCDELGSIATGVGMKSVLVDTSIPLANPNYTSVALQIKNSGADAIDLVMSSEDDTGITTALYNDGVTPKAVIADTWTQGFVNNADQKAVQNVFVDEPFASWDIHNAGTTAMQAAFQKYAPNVQPTENPYFMYTGVLTLAEGLKNAGANPTSASLVTALNALTDWDADGLWANKISYGADFLKNSSTCAFFLQVQGTSLVPATQTPFCGQHVAP